MLKVYWLSSGKTKSHDRRLGTKSKGKGKCYPWKLKHELGLKYTIMFLAHPDMFVHICRIPVVKVELFHRRSMYIHCGLPEGVKGWCP